MPAVTTTASVPLPGRLVRKGMNASILSAVLWSFCAATISGPVFAGLLLALHMSNVQIGVISSLGLLFLPLQIAGALLQQRYLHRKRFWCLATLANFITYGLIVVLVAVWAQLPATVAALLFLAIYAMGQMAVQLVAPVFLAWLGELVPPRESNSFWNRRQGWAQVTAVAAAIGVGWAVDALGRDARTTYVLMLGVGVFFGLLSLWAQALVPDPDPERHSRPSLLANLRHTWRNPRIRQLILFFGFQELCVGMACPFFFIYLQKSMALSMTVVQGLTALSSIISFLAGYLFSVVGNKYGRKPVLILCTLLKGVEFIFWGTLLPGHGWMGALPCFILGGVANMGLASAQVSLLTSMERKRSQSFSIAVFFAVFGLCGFISGSFSGVVYDWLGGFDPGLPIHLTPFNWICLIAVPGYFLSLLFFASFREAGATPTAQVVKTLLFDNPLRAVYHAHVLAAPMEEQSRVATLDQASGTLLTAELLHDLQSPSSRVRESAVWSIARTAENADPQLLDTLIRLLDQPELGLQATAARALGRRHTVAAPAVPALARLARTGDPTLARVCITALGQIKGAGAVAALEALLADDRQQSRWAPAAEVLGQLGDWRHTRLIYRAYAQETHPVLKVQLLLALARTVAADRPAVHAIFEAEERRPGSEIERLIQSLQQHLAADSSTQTTMETALANYDAGRPAMALDRVTTLVLAQTRAGTAPDVAMSENRENSATGRWLLQTLSTDLYQAPPGIDHYLLLTALITADALIAATDGAQAA